MAEELSPGRFKRVIGEPCPRGTVREAGQEPCRGQLVRSENFMSGHVDMECDICHFKWSEEFRVPLTIDQQSGQAPKWRLVPDTLVEALARAEFDRSEMERHPDPKDRRSWESLSAERETRINTARGVIGRWWPVFGEWFEDFFGVAPDDSPRNMSARRALEEIAIPTLQRYEERFDTPDTPRIALEATLNAR